MARLSKRSPLASLENLEEQMEEMFSRFPHPWEGDSGKMLRPLSWQPGVDIYEKDNHLIVECECPGMNRDDIDVSLDDSTLTISGERKREEEVEEEDFYRAERSFETFKRSFRLPDDVEADGVDASYEDGVLTISLPIVESQQKKQIEIT